MMSKKRSENQECQLQKVIFMGKPTSLNGDAGMLCQSRHSTEPVSVVVERHRCCKTRKCPQNKTEN